MAGSPPKPPPPTSAAGSSSSTKQPPTLATGSSSSSSSPNPPPTTLTVTKHPSYVELVDSYLRPRFVSGTKVADFIHEADLYSADPFQLTRNRLQVTKRSGQSAWYFFTPLHPKGSAKTKMTMKRNVETGREGTWVGVGGPTDVFSKGQRIGQRRSFSFQKKVGGNLVNTAWHMMELRLDPDEGGQEAGSPDLLALCKVYRFPDAVADDWEVESSVVVAKADAKAPTAAAVVTPGPKGADEEIGADTAAGPGRKRTAGDEDPGAEPVASSPGRQNKPGGESADAAKTGEFFADSKDALDAAEKTAADSGAETVASSAGRQNKADGEIESADAATTTSGQIFADGKGPLDAAEQEEHEKPRDPRDNRTYNFFEGSSAPLDAPEEAEQEPRDPQFYRFI